MTVIDKSPPTVQCSSAEKSRRNTSKAEPKKESKSPERFGRRDSDLISTATSALRRLHFRSAGGSRAKRGQTTSVGGQSIPKLMVMGSSTASETTTNTSTDSSNTVCTMVTVTDAEQEDRVDVEEMIPDVSFFLEEKPPAKPNESLDAKRELKEVKEPRIPEMICEMRSSEEILSEFDELFLENEKRIRAEEERNQRRLRKGNAKYCQEKEGEGSRKGIGASARTSPVANPRRDHHFFSKPKAVDARTTRSAGSKAEKPASHAGAKEKPKTEKPRSNVRTIQSELPQLTIRSNPSKKNRKVDQRNERDAERTCSKTGEDGLQARNPRRSGSPKLPTTSPSPKLNSSISSNLQNPVEMGPATSAEVNPTTSEVVPLTASNLEKHEKQLSEELKRQNRPKYESIFSMDSPTTIRSSPPVGYFDPTKKSSKFEFPSCISPTEINSAFAFEGDAERDTDTDVEDASEGKMLLEENGNKKRRRGDRKSISVETPVKLQAAEEKIASNRKSDEGYRDLVLEDDVTSPQDRKYSILTTDGSIKNFVSENSEEYKKSSEGVDKENKKKKNSGAARRGSECPQRHRRVSIIQGDSLRHFIFEEPEPRTKANRRKTSMMPEEETTKNLLLEDTFTRKSSLVPGDTLRNLLGDEAARKASGAPEEKARKFSINTLGDIVSARKFSLLPPGEIYTSQIDGKTTEIIKLTPGTKGRPLATIVVQQASIQRGSISGPSQKQDALLDVANTFTLEELHEFDMKYGSPHHCRSQSVKTPGRSCGRPNYLCLPQQRSRVASMPNTGVEEEYYRLRHFSITGKGVINRGDSLKSRRSRSNNSVASSNSSHSTEHLASNMGTVGSHPGSARTSAECSLASSRESSTTSMPYKVVMLGATGVGKTSLVSQFMTSEYLHAYDASLDEEYGEKSVSVLLDGEESELVFVDHSSSEMQPENCITTYESQAYIVVYSVVDRSSLQTAEEILQSLWKTDSLGMKAVILVGNKADLVRSRTVTTEEGKNTARSYDCKFIETSVGINHNVDELLVGILSQIRLKIQHAKKPKRNKSPLRSCIGKEGESPRKLRNSRLSASLKVKGLFGRVWARDGKSKSSSGDSLDAEELDQYKNYCELWFQVQ